MFLRQVLIVAMFSAAFAAVLAQTEECSFDAGICFDVNWKTATLADIEKIKSDARGEYGSTPLHFAVWFSENPAVIKALLESGADVETRDNNGTTPLHYAARNKNPEVLAALLKASADVGVRNKHGNTPLHFAAWDNPNPEVIFVLLKAGADLFSRSKNGGTALHWAAGYNENTEVITILLQAGADVSAQSKNGNTPLHTAVRYNKNPDVIAALLQAGADIAARSNDGNTPLHRAAMFNENPEVIMALLKAGANPQAKNKEGKIPFELTEKNEGLKGTKAYWALNDAQFNNPKSTLPATAQSTKNTPPAETAFENGWRSVVVVKTAESQGSGVVIKPNLVATNCHVVGDGGNIVVYKANNRRAQTETAHNARIYRGDEERDLCLLNVPGLWGIVAEIRRAETLRVGEEVFAIGAPQGLEYSLSAGVVSQLRNNKDDSAPLVQTDAAISPGSSGGGLFDSAGHLVGITTFKGAGEADEGITFAIPAEWILQMQ